MRKGEVIHNYVHLSRSQLDTLLFLHENECGKTVDIGILQTYSKSGGTHMYAMTSKSETHVAKNGNMIEIGIVTGGEVDRHTAGPGEHNA